MAKKVKSVSFNDNNNEEKEMLKYIGRRNFSKYIKGLIRNDKLLHDMQSEGIKKEIPFGGINNDKPKNKYKQYLINEKSLCRKHIDLLIKVRSNLIYLKMFNHKFSNFN